MEQKRQRECVSEPWTVRLPRGQWPLRLGVALGLGLMVLLAGGSPVGAQATRTWVSGVGDDVNPCSRTAPCKTFAGAISKTAAAGEINVLDPGGFGAVTITKSISIVGEGVTGGVLVANTNGIIINAGVNDVVVLRGLDIEGTGNGLNGIRYLQAAAVYVERTTINGFGGNTGRGIDVQAAADGELYLQDVDIRNSAGAGVFLKAASAPNGVKVSINNSRIENNNIGVDARDKSRVTIRDSVISGNTGSGVQGVLDAGNTTEVNIESTIINGNGTGIQSGNGTGTSTVRIANVMVYGNANGIAIAGGSHVVSFGNNMIFGNTNNGAPSSSLPLQ